MVTDRRRLLSTLAGALGLALAGCSTRTGRTGTTTQSSTATTGASTTATRAGNTTPTEPATTRTTTTESATTEPTVAIEGPDGPVILEEDERTMVRLDLAASGGTIEEVSWEAIEQPDGSGVGILDYGEYAKIRVSDPGEYVLQVTATFESGSLARDTTTVVVTSETATTTSE